MQRFDISGWLPADTARVLVFEYDADGFLVFAMGSCLGGPDPSIEVRAGLLSADVVRRALAGEVITERLVVSGRLVVVRHRPIWDEDGSVTRVRCAAVDATELAAMLFVRALAS